MIDLKQLAQARVLVVGDVMLDRYWYGDVNRISPEAPVPVVHVVKEEDRLGGAANVANNVAALGAQVTLMTALGEDDPARVVRDLLKSCGIDFLVHQDTSLQTIVKLRVVGRSQQLLRLDFESKPDHEILKQLLKDFSRVIEEFDVVVFSDYGKGGLSHIPEMIRLAKEANKFILIDPKGRDYSKYKGATVITPNRSELAEVIGHWIDESDLQEKVESLCQELQLKAILLTRSEEGMTLFEHEQAPVTIPTTAREVFDVTGAGDTVIATLAVMLGSGQSLKAATNLANKAAGIVVGKFATASVTAEELLNS